MNFVKKKSSLSSWTMKGKAQCLFFSPRGEAGPSISCLGVLCFSSFSACSVILFMSILSVVALSLLLFNSRKMFCTPNFTLTDWFLSLKKNLCDKLHQHLRMCRQILLPRPWRPKLRDPWAKQLKMQQTGEVRRMYSASKLGPVR